MLITKKKHILISHLPIVTWKRTYFKIQMNKTYLVCDTLKTLKKVYFALDITISLWKFSHSLSKVPLAHLSVTGEICPIIHTVIILLLRTTKLNELSPLFYYIILLLTLVEKTRVLIQFWKMVYLIMTSFICLYLSENLFLSDLKLTKNY